MGWRVPELLDRVRAGADLYDDAVSRVRMPSWSRGRTVLVGDAADGTSLLGEGSSTAICGAATLARALATVPDDVAAALHAYEHDHRRLVRRRQRGVSVASHLLVPGTVAGSGVRDAAFRVWPATDRTRRALRRASVGAEQRRPHR
jgi:2-polyprenyl-6-methoxyphenol hydroxylase-like FAD-dependent oxidoreductase